MPFDLNGNEPNIYIKILIMRGIYLMLVYMHMDTFMNILLSPPII